MRRANIIRAWAGLGHHIIDLNGLGPGWALSPWAWAGPAWGLLSPWRTLIQIRVINQCTQFQVSSSFFIPKWAVFSSKSYQIMAHFFKCHFEIP